MRSKNGSRSKGTLLRQIFQNLDTAITILMLCEQLSSNFLLNFFTSLANIVELQWGLVKNFGKKGCCKLCRGDFSPFLQRP